MYDKQQTKSQAPIDLAQFPSFSRRRMLQRTSSGFGAVAFSALLNQTATADRRTLPDSAGLQKLHHPPRAKSVIFCYMSGGVSQVDTFDPKPKLKELHGQPMPGKVER